MQLWFPLGQGYASCVALARRIRFIAVAPLVSTGLVPCYATLGMSTLRHHREHGHGNSPPPARDRIVSMRCGGEPLP